MNLLYNLAIAIYAWAIRLAAFFHPKAAQFIKGRHDLFQALTDFKKVVDSGTVIWMHCASLGEFEQGRPIIEALKKKQPEATIVLTFFSPSGYEQQKDFPLADYVTYLPFDLPEKANRFVAILQPTLAIFVKYEFWLNHLRALYHRKIPVVLISAVFRPQQIFFRFYGGIFLKELKKFDHLFVQDQNSADLLSRIGINQYTVAGDTRIDRVISIAKSARDFPEITTFVAGHQILVCGSTWMGDENILIPFINQELPENWKVIIAPHDIRENRIKEIIDRLKISYQRFSKINFDQLEESKVLLIDNIGMLSSLYQYGRLAFIGGGFGVSIHNTLEPMAFHLPVIFGPKFEKFIEARQMIAREGAFSVTNIDEFRVAFQNLQDQAYYEKTTTTITQFLHQNSGSSEQILQYLNAKMLKK
ncbi:MAG: 3-deoxy-D-manno-octulosonic acid transferase [Saprospiraceae bacterium]|nr:MAG: 3-deoxy-D-manno-octulosonic acid transferase [Saprospiraceae bacterium]